MSWPWEKIVEHELILLTLIENCLALTLITNLLSVKPILFLEFCTIWLSIHERMKKFQVTMPLPRSPPVLPRSNGRTSRSTPRSSLRFNMHNQVVYALRSRCMLVVQIKFCHLLLDAVEWTSLNSECVMEIHGLLPFLRKFVKNMNLRELAGQTAAIDTSCWLHKGLSVSFAQTGRRDRWEIFSSCRSIDWIFTFDVESFSFYNFLGAVKFFWNV